MITLNLHSIAIATSALALGVTSASAQSVDPSHKLVVRFHMPPDTQSGESHYDTNTAMLALFADAPAHGTTATAQLFDGARLLGTSVSAESSGNFFPGWADYSSGFSRDTAVDIDGRSLIDRSIDGTIVVRFDAPVQLTYVGLDVGLGLSRVINPVPGGQVIVDSISVTAVPEPSTALMLGLGGLVLAARLGRLRQTA